MSGLLAGAAAADLTPRRPQFLFGYPHVPRTSTGVHDPLQGGALYLSDGRASLLFCSADVIFVDRDLTARVRARIEAATGLPGTHVLVSATHTHSGPVTVDYLSNAADPVVPKADPAYLQQLEDGLVEAAVAAWRSARPAEAGLAVADGSGIGTNRRAPDGPADPQVPVLLARERGGGRPIGCLLVCSMHPTVLHEDSTLISGDFPAMTRQYLHEVLGPACPILYHTGPEGNQSPRHVTRENTFAEAGRLGGLLGSRVAQILPRIGYADHLELAADRELVDLPRRPFPAPVEAEERLRSARRRFEELKAARAPRQEVRTAECDWFGAEETLTLARAAQSGELQRACEACLPAEIQALRVGPWRFVGWPGEVFIEYALEVKREAPDTWIINLANGELQGYIVTEEAAQEGGYEASNALFGPESGALLVARTLEVLHRLP